MRTRRPSAFLSLIGVVLFWPYVLTMSISPILQTTGSSSLTAGQEERSHVTKRSIISCEREFDTYCLNNGTCILLEDMKEHHCKCKKGFYGPRCATPELVGRPMDEEQVVVILFCVTLLLIGLGGALYFFYKWCKRNKFPSQPKQQGYKGVQTVSSFVQIYPHGN
ncbi:pro-epidermal growth factor-like [Poeciliopsis prolifica]|uniref:pro-epidermal growth factor-like n=1 Tax=Poeciliopsis prolifica TaxID=188132 RepID=UPI0024139C26|nr:pro-epidermal growth factor-like [Poeciliopsis prolifica]